MKDFILYIPSNDVITESGYIDYDGLVKIIKSYKNNPTAIQFIAEMME